MVTHAVASPPQPAAAGVLLSSRSGIAWVVFLILVVTHGCARSARPLQPPRRTVAERDFRLVEEIEWARLPGSHVALSTHFESEWPQVRERAALAWRRLGRGGDDEVIARQFEVDADAAVREALAAAASVCSRRTATQILRKAREFPADVRASAAAALERAGGERAVELVSTFLSDDDASVRSQAIFGVGVNLTPQLAGVVAARLPAETDPTARWALWSLAARSVAVRDKLLELPDAHRLLGEARDDPNFLVAYFARQTAARLAGRQEVVAALEVAAAEDRFWLVRTSLLEELTAKIDAQRKSGRNSQSTEKLLLVAATKALESPDAFALRDRAARALAWIQDSALVNDTERFVLAMAPHLKAAWIRGLCAASSPTHDDGRTAAERDADGECAPWVLRALRLDECLVDPSPAVRRAALIRSLKCDVKRGVDGPQNFAAAADPALRAEWVRAAPLVDAAAVATFLNDASPRVREAMLLRLRSDESVPVPSDFPHELAAHHGWLERMLWIDVAVVRLGASASHPILQRGLQDSIASVALHAFEMARRVSGDTVQSPAGLNSRLRLSVSPWVPRRNLEHEGLPPRIVIHVDGSERFVIALDTQAAPVHAAMLVALARSGYMVGRKVGGVERDEGVLFAMGASDPWLAGPIVPELSPVPLRRGAVVGVHGYQPPARFDVGRWDDPGSFRVLLCPRPALAATTTRFGEVVLGMEVVDGLRPGATITAVEVVD